MHLRGSPAAIWLRLTINRIAIITINIIAIITINRIVIITMNRIAIVTINRIVAEESLYTGNTFDLSRRTMARIREHARAPLTAR